MCYDAFSHQVWVEPHVKTSGPRQTTQTGLSERVYPTMTVPGKQPAPRPAARPPPRARLGVFPRAFGNTSRFRLEANAPRAQLRNVKLRTRRRRAPAGAVDGAAAFYKAAVDLPGSAQSSVSVVATQCPVPNHCRVSVVFTIRVTRKHRRTTTVRAPPPRAGRPKGRRACRGRSVIPVPLKGWSARVAGAGSRVWACARCRPWSSHYVFQPLCAPSRSRRMLSHARSPPPPPPRVPMIFAGLVAVGYPAPPQCDPFHRRNQPSCRVSGLSRIPSLDPLGSGKTPDSPETRSDGWFRRTKGGGRPSQVLCGPAGPNLAEIHQPTEAPHATPELSRRYRARRPTRQQIPSKMIPANRIWRGVGNSFEKQITKSGQFLIRGLSIRRDRLSINPQIIASFPLASFSTVCSRVSRRGKQS